MKSVHFPSEQTVASVDLLDRADESLMIVVPEVDDELLDRLFALTKRLDVDLLISRKSVEKNGRQLRHQIKRLQDINFDIEVRVADEKFPAFALVDNEHLYCFSQESARLAGRQAEEMVEATRSLWARSEALVSAHPSRPEPSSDEVEVS